MDESAASDEQQPDLGDLRSRFPGFFPPDDSQLREFMIDGMVAFDANALLDVYRFNDRARREYLAALRKLAERLWIPYRVGQELLENRLRVIEECSTATNKLAEELDSAFGGVTQVIRRFGDRRGLSTQQIARLEMLVKETQDQVIEQANSSYTFDLRLETSIKGDPILSDLETVLAGKVGPPLDEPQKAKAEALRRLDAGIPPGYKDWKKDRERAIGDCIIWFQLIREAALRRRPVVLVCNERKPDWVREDLGRKVGAQPELVAEMMDKSAMPFHLMSVQSFLVHARKYLGVTVSESTVQQAKYASENPIQKEVDELVRVHGQVQHIERETPYRIWLIFADGHRMGVEGKPPVNATLEAVSSEYEGTLRDNSSRDPWSTLPGYRRDRD